VTGRKIKPPLALVTGCMVATSSLLPTAVWLRAAGFDIQVPDVLAAVDCPPPWRAWSRHLMDLIDTSSRPILVGHSLACTLVAELASRCSVGGLIMVDGFIPPASGAVPPASGVLRDLVAALPVNNGLLPPWSDWWNERQARVLGVATLAQDPQAFEEFRNGLPRFAPSWFDDTIDLASWGHVPVGYIRTSEFFERSADEAEQRGWPVIRLNGTHMHSMLAPAETADAIEKICSRLPRWPALIAI
jgi:pimeloyl-ACP methyl ester carboxylesterase